MFDNLFGTEAGPVVNYLFAFILVIVLILVVAWLFRRFVSRADLHFGPRTGQRRLAVVEASGVDAQRRLILVRRDEVEHLLLIGGPTDIVVEANIGKEARREARPAPQPAAPAQPAPPRARPPVREPREPVAPQVASHAAMQRPAAPAPRPAQPVAPDEGLQRPRFTRPPEAEQRPSQHGEARQEPHMPGSAPERAEPQAPAMNTPGAQAPATPAAPQTPPRRYSFETPSEKEAGRLDRPLFPDRNDRGENG